MHMKSCEINSIRQHNEIIKETMRALEPTLTEDELNRKMKIYIGKIKKVINASRMHSAEKSKRIRAIRQENRELDADEAYQKWQKENGLDTHEDDKKSLQLLRDEALSK